MMIVKSNKLILVTMVALFLGTIMPAFSEEQAQPGEEAEVSTSASTSTEVKSKFRITDLGIVEVVETWRNMKMDSGIFPYFSATRESGIIPVRVQNRKFTVSFATRSYLKREEGRLYFVTPDYYYEDSPLNVEIEVEYPSNLAYLTSNVEPTELGEQKLLWKLEGVSHKVIVAEFEQVSPFATPDYPTGPLWQVDPTTLPELTADDIPRSPDEVMKEFEVIIKMLAADKDVDPDVVRILRKTLSKFYYTFAIYGLVRDFVPEGTQQTS